MSAPRQRLHYPPSAIAFVTAAWVVAALETTFFAFGCLILLPLLPVFFGGPLCLIAWAHDYARRHAVARPARQRRLFHAHAPHPAT
jgi:hypothetical protein